MLKPLAAVAAACALLVPLALYAHGDEGKAQGTGALPAPVAPVGAGDELHLPADLGQALGIRVSIVPGKQDGAPRMAKVIGDPARTWRVPAPFAGHLLAPKGGFPQPGTHVDAGEVLAVLAPTLRPVDEGNLHSAIAVAELEGVVSGIKLHMFKMGYSGQTLGMDQNPTLMPKLEAEVSGVKQRVAALHEGLGRRREVRAPIAGVVGNSVLYPGAAVAGGQPLMDLFNPDALWIEVYDQSADLPQKIYAVTDDGRLLHLKRQGESPALAAGSTLTLYQLTGGSHGLRPSERAALRLAASDVLAQPLQVPAAALGDLHDGTARVWVRTGVQRFRARRVKVASAGNGSWMVTAGLLPGERVVTAGLSPPGVEQVSAPSPAKD